MPAANAQNDRTDRQKISGGMRREGADFDAFREDARLRELLRQREIVDAAGSFSMVVTDRLRFASALSPDGGSVYAWSPPGLEVRSTPGQWSGSATRIPITASWSPCFRVRISTSFASPPGNSAI